MSEYTPNVGLALVTYRREGANNSQRYISPLLSIHQTLMEGKAAYDGEVKMAVIDSSPQPHHAIQMLAADPRLSDRLFYYHIPSRNGLDRDKLNIPKMFAPTDEEMKDEFFQKNIRKVLATRPKSAAEFKEIDGKYIYGVDRLPTGKKKDIAAYKLNEAFENKMDLLLTIDDDDLQHSSYVKEYAEILGTGKYTMARLFNYPVWLYSTDPDKQFWGIHNLPIQRKGDEVLGMRSDSYNVKITVAMSGQLSEKTQDQFYGYTWDTGTNKWDPRMHDGAFHGYTKDSWEYAVRENGGFPFATQGEDVINNTWLRQSMGSKYKIGAVGSKFSYLGVRGSSADNCSNIIIHQPIEQSDAPQWTNNLIGIINECTLENSCKMEEYGMDLAHYMLENFSLPDPGTFKHAGHDLVF